MSSDIPIADSNPQRTLTRPVLRASEAGAMKATVNSNVSLCLVTLPALLPFLLLATTIGGCASAGGASAQPGASTSERSQTAVPPPAIEFDSKGVDFKPWLSDLTARLRSNWNVPMAALRSKGHVVLTFRVHKDGSITDLMVRRPSRIDSFNKSAYYAVSESNPVAPLPSAYPDEHAFFTLTFFFNEAPS